MKCREDEVEKRERVECVQSDIQAFSIAGG